jgi:hypothetical protein
MTFPSYKQRTPAAIGAVTLVISTDGSGSTDYTARFEILDAQGNVLATPQHDLLKILTAGQKAALDNFMATLRAKGAADLLS